MGQWGTETYSCDDVFDYLDDSRDIYNITQKEANKILKKVCKEKPYYEDIYIGFNKLGVVVWLLKQNLFVPVKLLRECFEIAKKISSKKVIKEQGWTKPVERKRKILAEIKIIKNAIKKR